MAQICANLPRWSRAYQAASCLAVIASCTALTPTARAQTLRLEDGRVLRGMVAATAGVAENPNAPSPQAGEIAVQPIYVIDDQLRRIFIGKRKVVEVLDQIAEPRVTIRLWHDVATSGGYLASVGPSLGITPFDKYGRRIYEMQTKTGPLAVVQGITELTPRYAKVEALRGSQPRDVVWDMRLALSSIPQDKLTEILTQGVPRDDPEARLEVVRFYIAAERYAQARRQLQQIIEEFPDLEGLDAEARQLRQMGARRILAEIQMRRSAGQQQLAEYLLLNFPTEGVAGETLAEVRELIGDLERTENKINDLRQRLSDAVKQIADVDDRGLASPLAAEIAAELSPNNLDRLAPFTQLADDASLTGEQKVALAITGWLLGADGADKELAIAIATARLRAAVLAYLRESLPHNRTELLTEVRTLTDGNVENLAKLIAHLKPPHHEPKYIENASGAWTHTAPGVTEDGDFAYHVQLPPEYDPYRRYPTIIVLNGAYNTPIQELEFWAGQKPPNAGDQQTARRIGQAGRHGFIVVAVEWLKPQQYAYEFSAREHIAVLTCLRDASRRYSIDADRVFLSGHGIGGDAVWDLGQAHPDLWAGVIPFNARSGNYVRHYWENAEYVPWYFVAGEKDGSVVKDNAPLWDRYVKKLSFDATIVEYQGRGHEPFHDEVLEALDWMGRRQRRDPPEEFACNSMRPWDNFFWWVECHDFDDRWMLYPAEFNDRDAKPAPIEGLQRNGNRLRVKTVADAATIWLSPRIIDFSQPVTLIVNNQKQTLPSDGVTPDPGVLLEDVRTRGDRQRPFWARVEWP